MTDDIIVIITVQHGWLWPKSYIM